MPLYQKGRSPKEHTAHSDKVERVCVCVGVRRVHINKTMPNIKIIDDSFEFSPPVGNNTPEKGPGLTVKSSTISWERLIQFRERNVTAVGEPVTARSSLINFCKLAC